MSESAFEALLGALLRLREEEGRLKVPEAEAIRARLSYRGLDDGTELVEAVKKLSVLRMLKRRRFVEIGYAIGKKNVPLSLDEVLKDLLGRYQDSGKKASGPEGFLSEGDLRYS